MTLKKITESKLRKLVLKSIKKDFFINEIDLVITDDPKDKKSYNEKIKFMYIGSAKIYRRKKNLKKYTNTWEDYHDEEIVYKWLEDKHKQEKGDIVYIQGLIKFKNDSFIFSSCIPIGSWHITNDISKALNLSFEISENLKKGGHFIGTCYDGMKVFQRLNDLKNGHLEMIDEFGNKVYSITKKYEIDDFTYAKDDREKLFGQEIDVYMNSIGQTMKEYLVNFELFTEIMKEYDLVLTKPKS